MKNEKEEMLSVGANDQVNPDAANGVECDEQRSPAARVERIVRPPAIQFAEGVTTEYTRTDATPIQNTDEEVSIRLMDYGHGHRAYFGLVYKQLEKPDKSGAERRVVMNDLVRRDQILKYIASAIGLSKDEIKRSLESCLSAKEYHMDHEGQLVPVESHQAE